MAVKKASWATVFLFGDSLTQRSFSPDGCWGSCLADFLIRRCDVIARGFSGYNTRANKLILPSLLNADIAKNTAALTIFLGANDAASTEGNPEQHVPLDEYGQNLKDMVEYCLSCGLRRDQIILISPPAVAPELWDAHCVNTGKPNKVGSRSNQLAELYASTCCSVAKELGTSMVDLHSEMMKNEDYKSYLCDGLHLSESGSHLLFNHLKPIISQLTSHVPNLMFPEWSEIANKDLESAEQSLKDLEWL